MGQLEQESDVQRALIDNLGVGVLTVGVDGEARAYNLFATGSGMVTLHRSERESWSDFFGLYDPATGAASSRRVFVDTREFGGMPDGATVDADGRIWMALFRAGKVGVFHPDGKLDRLIDLPVKLVSSVAFGGPDLDRLFVTSLDPSFMNEPAEPGGGDLFVIDGLGARGLPEPLYAG